VKNEDRFRKMELVEAEINDLVLRLQGSLQRPLQWQASFLAGVDLATKSKR
jgi:hypothetical protein